MNFICIRNNRTSRYIFRYNSTCTNDSTFSNCNVWKYGCICTNRAAFFQYDWGKLNWSLFASRVFVVGKVALGPIKTSSSILIASKEVSAFDSYIVPNDHIVFYKCMITNIEFDPITAPGRM